MTHLQEILSSPSTFATVFLTVAADKFGSEFLGWDPETIRMEMDQQFSIKMPDVCFNRLMVAVQLVTSDAFYKSLPDFIQACICLTHGMMTTDTWEPADALEIAWGVTEALIIWPPPPKEEEPFTQDIVKYIQMALEDEGIMNPPDVLRIGAKSDLLPKVQATYSDDPEMFAAIYEVEQGKGEDINQGIRNNLRLLIHQLHDLKLDNGDTANSVQLMLKALQKESKQDDSLPSERR